MTLFLIYATALSCFGLIVLIAQGLREFNRIDSDEFLTKARETKPIFHDLKIHIWVPVANYFHAVIIPIIYKEFEIVISRVRINVLRIERLLLQLANYIRGKREVKINGQHHHYWGGFGKNNKEDDVKIDQN